MRWADDEVDKRLLVHGAARDVRTDVARHPALVDEAAVDCVIGPDRVVRTIDAVPSADLSALVGRAARGGWRAAARDVVGADSPLLTVLDDVPIAVMLSSYGDLRDGSMDLGSVRPLMVHMRDLCAGWAGDATPMRVLDSGGALPLPGVVPAPALDVVHPLDSEPRAPMVPGEVRRSRCLDVLPGDEVRVEATFRDVWYEPAGGEGVLHEYRLAAVLDTERVVTSIEAEPRVLPYAECTLAAASPARLVGRHITEVADAVTEGAGRETCTHLDDLLRSLAVVPALLACW